MTWHTENLFWIAASFAAFTLTEWMSARWIPWWRRYLSVLVLIPAAAIELRFGNTMEADRPLIYLATAINLWNQTTGNHNRRNKNDIRAKEAAAQELTDVQTRSYRQQVAEANA